MLLSVEKMSDKSKDKKDYFKPPHPTLSNKRGLLRTKEK